MIIGSVPHNHVAIIGTGFGGIATAVRLRKAGFDDLVLLDRADDVGGVWRDNDYPGAAVDVQSHLYSFSFAPNPNWRSTFAKQPELHAYLKRVTDQVDLSSRLVLECNAFTADVDQQSEGTVWTAGGCDSWYLNESGRNANLWPGTTFDYRRRTLRFDPAAHLMHRLAATAVPVAA